MYRLRKAGAVAAVTAVMALALSGCAPAAPAEEVKLSFLTYTSPNVTKETWEKAVADIEAENPNIKIELLYTPDLDRQGYAKQLLASGQLPDILWDVPLTDFVDAGALLPYEASDFEGLNIPAGFNAVDGKQYSLANGTFIYPGVFYNPDAFDAAGVGVPTTFDELVDAAAAIKANGKTPFLLSSGSDTWSTEFLLNALVCTDVLGSNPDWLIQRKADKVSFSDPEFVKAVNKFVELRDAGSFNSDALSINYSQANAAWATGDYAMWPMGGWGGGVKSDVFTPGVFSMPTDDGTPILPTVIGPSLYISATTAHPEEARKVAVALAGLTSLQEVQMKNDAQFPVIDGITPPEGTTQATLDGLKLYEDKSIKQVYGFPNTLSGDDMAPSGWTGEYDKAIQALIGGGSSADFVKALDDAWATLSK
ncbi:sugar ABC transporter substrate-binding protein [Salinibacterium xinjiangense]|uniref:Carbohydrate ABC transporter substrate-binding protein, CUT1 family n=2 Tax=Salinibacterium xinjiangense TaxID=386302 RepID=A0A2C8Z5R4_9MICO|nr:sugar ABC transporter substrate-binding protein [Salinibacterium xinjiangense]SOE59067.1 carbohydrate ABC transporter substrate-binding protein, CUT1 family [Salinibacterium xinjiangense]